MSVHLFLIACNWGVIFPSHPWDTPRLLCSLPPPSLAPQLQPEAREGENPALLRVATDVLHLSLSDARGELSCLLNNRCHPTPFRKATVLIPPSRVLGAALLPSPWEVGLLGLL